MPAASNELGLEAFLSTPPPSVTYVHGPEIEVERLFSPVVQLPVREAAGTPNPHKRAPLTVLCVPKEFQVRGWRLKAALMVEERRTRNGVVTTAYLEAFTEYGAAKDEAEALADLISSLGEYRESLTRRREKLSDAALEELRALNSLIERADH